eukprot:CAMPEP_0183318268 /NCGR_PEP_ID=MMETSP0160_2-20130417/60228_1 /TAXON_ID=2839 ORGANISM="Odontella Sinensis, Strain Grunow 1884" /NCGR_SAMPLE_ID=MMETSP0160_2 /ASSEMBLY_ACC=CAM_ASM_000250 /LENGTH=45 /DNA_ID= /DNA_START= /DNA_END= /DNA_ORIENTATION=
MTSARDADVSTAWGNLSPPRRTLQTETRRSELRSRSSDGPSRGGG